MREGPLSDLFRSTEPGASEPVDSTHAPEPDFGLRGQDGTNYVAVIRVVGVGGAGCNAVNRMIEAGLRGVEFVAVNTDRQALEESEADVRITVGAEITRGLGTGGDPNLGEQAVRESEDQIRRALRGSDLVFIAAGEGGGTELRGRLEHLPAGQLRGLQELVNEPGFSRARLACDESKLTGPCGSQIKHSL